MTRPTSAQPPASGRRSALLVVGVVLVAAIVTLAAVLLLNRPPETAGPTNPTPSEPASMPPSASPEPSDEPSEAPPEPSDTPEPTPVALPDGWTLVHQFGTDGRWVGGEVAYGYAGYLAVGRQWGGGEGGPRVTVNVMLLSADGRTWTEVPYPNTSQGEPFFRTLHGTTDGGYVLHGNVQTDSGSIGIALHSIDGMIWEPIETGLPQITDILAVEEGPQGRLLVNGQTGGGNASLWLSPDGLTWEKVHEFVQDEQYVQIVDGDGGADGYVVIGRRIDFDGGGWTRFGFASADGREWIETPEPFGPEDPDFVGDSAVSSMGGDWVATLAMRDDTTATFVSTDGLEWRALSAIPLRNQDVASAGLLEEIGGEVIASPGGGMDFSGTPGVFSAPDGVDWSPVDLGVDAWLGGLAIGEGAVAIIGTIPSPDGEFASQIGIWIRAF